MTDDGEKVFLCGVTCANNNYLRVCAHEKTLELSSVICHLSCSVDMRLFALLRLKTIELFIRVDADQWVDME